MPLFRKSSSTRAGGPAAPLEGRLAAVPPWPGPSELRSDDWAEIADLLDDAARPADGSGRAEDRDGSEGTGGPFGRSDRTAAVLAALADLRARTDHPVLPAGPVSDRLLDIWDLAHGISPEAAAPAAALMTALLHRDLAGAAEVVATCDEIEARLAAAVA